MESTFVALDRPHTEDTNFFGLCTPSLEPSDFPYQVLPGRESKPAGSGSLLVFPFPKRFPFGEAGIFAFGFPESTVD